MTLVGHGNGVLAAFSLAKARALQKACREVRFFSNLHHYLSEQLIASWRKCAVLSCPSIAGRVLMYLENRARETGSDEIAIPATEEGFANYLGVHRAALSRVLGKLKKEGRLSYKRSVFTLLNAVDAASSPRQNQKRVEVGSGS